MRYFEDLQVGELLIIGGHLVDAAEAADFARRYDPRYIPPLDAAYVHRGPQISPWQAAALSWKLLSELAATASIAEASFERPAEVQWPTAVHVGDALRVEAELLEILPPNTHLREHGWARAKVALVTTGPAGFGAWGDDDQELVDDVAVTYVAHLRARRREEVSIYHGLG
jgi:acyl dehydratase